MDLSAVRLASVATERFPIRGAFTISRGSKREAVVVVARLTGRLADGREIEGRGECLPYGRYGETVESVTEAITEQAASVAAGLNRIRLQAAMPAGAARNALDCAFWDLEAKAAGLPAWRLAGLAEPPGPVTSAFTISLGAASSMGEAAGAARLMPILKLKLGADESLDRVAEVHRQAPGARLIVDANEAWTVTQLERLAPALARLGVVLIEQPLPAGDDHALAELKLPIPLAADESCHDSTTIGTLRDRYQVANIKLDKTGGLTEALKAVEAARAAGLGIMVGCMVATSLAIAPALLVAQGADFVDLDGPLLLARDRSPGLTYDGAMLFPPAPELWG